MLVLCCSRFFLIECSSLMHRLLSQQQLGVSSLLFLDFSIFGASKLLLLLVWRSARLSVPALLDDFLFSLAERHVCGAFLIVDCSSGLRPAWEVLTVYQGDCACISHVEHVHHHWRGIFTVGLVTACLHTSSLCVFATTSRTFW